jgi:hypothetical protein
MFTAITRPMIDENAVQLAVDDKNDVPLSDLGDALDDDERRRLEESACAGVQAEELKKRGLGSSVGRITRLPIDKLESDPVARHPADGERSIASEGGRRRRRASAAA